MAFVNPRMEHKDNQIVLYSAPEGRNPVGIPVGITRISFILNRVDSTKRDKKCCSVYLARKTILVIMALVKFGN